MAIIYEKKGKVAYVTLNRPEVLNAVNFATWDELTEAWTDIRDDPDVWVAVVTGAGDKAFSAGQDLKELGQTFFFAENKPPMSQLSDTLRDRLQPVRMQIWKPFIAAINGIATGAGMELALSCDLRIAADTATLGLAETKRSLIPGAGGTQRIPRLAPFCKALEILMTGDFIDAEEACRLGIINKVVPKADLMAEAEKMANALCDNGPLAVRAVKEAAYRGIEMSLQEGMELERALAVKVMSSEDTQEGVNAFVQKRKPEYKAK